MNGGLPQGRIFLILWFAFLWCVLVYGLVIFILGMPEKPLPIDDISFLTVAAGFAALPHLIGSIYQLRKNLSLGFYIVKLAIAETGAIFALVMYILFGCRELSLKAVGICLLGVVFLFPSKYLKQSEPDDPNRPPPIG